MQRLRKRDVDKRALAWVLGRQSEQDGRVHSGGFKLASPAH